MKAVRSTERVLGRWGLGRETLPQKKKRKEEKGQMKRGVSAAASQKL